MYKALHNKNGSLKHSDECKMAFGKKDAQCPRCVEMLNGAPARDGWQKDYYASQNRRSDSIKEHFNSHKHLSGGCGPVCTFGEW